MRKYNVLGSALQDRNDGHALVVGDIEDVDDSAAGGQAHVHKQGGVFKFLSDMGWMKNRINHAVSTAAVSFQIRDTSTYLKGKEAQDATNEESNHGNTVHLDLPPFLRPPLQNMAQCNAQVRGGACQVRGSDCIAAIFRGHCGERQRKEEMIRRRNEPCSSLGVCVCGTGAYIREWKRAVGRNRT